MASLDYQVFPVWLDYPHLAYPLWLDHLGYLDNQLACLAHPLRHLGMMVRTDQLVSKRPSLTHPLTLPSNQAKQRPFDDQPHNQQ